MTHPHDHTSQHNAHPTVHKGHGAHNVESDHQSGHDKHAGHSVSMFRDKFWVSLLLTIPTVAWSPMVQEWLGFTAPVFPGSR